MGDEAVVGAEQAWNTAVGIVMAKLRIPGLRDDIIREMRRMEQEQLPDLEAR